MRLESSVEGERFQIQIAANSISPELGETRNLNSDPANVLVIIVSDNELLLAPVTLH